MKYNETQEDANMLEQKLYTVADVAELTGLTDRTIRNYLKDGTLRGRKIGVQWRFTEADIDRLFSEVGEGGQKVLHPQDVISEFLKEINKEKPEGCIVFDLPYKKENRKKMLDRLEIVVSREASIACVWEVCETEEIIRVASRGTREELEDFVIRMKNIE